MVDFLDQVFSNSKKTTYDEAIASSNKTPIDFESMDPFDLEDARDGVFDDTHYITERNRW